MKKYKSLYGYVPINEPGGELVKFPFYKEKYKNWLAENSKPLSENEYRHFEFNEYRFAVDYTNWFLKWLVDEIHKYDPGKPMHVNNHQLFKWVSQYDFVEWRKFLTSLGGSAHASWHFGYFTRENYGYAISANSEILRSGAGELPWFLTEIQGGNNIYSGFAPLNPTPEKIAQWLWIPIGAGSKGGMFWCLNPRGSGIEAGEWAMLDFKNKPTYRLIAASQVADVVNKNKELFAKAKVLNPKIHICYTRESLWVEEKLIGNIQDDKYEARQPGAAMKSAIGYFEAISRMGLQPAFSELGEFDFSKKDYSGETIILSHQISIPSRYWNNLKSFVEKGGKLIIDGLTAYYNENAVNVMQGKFPFEDLFGAYIKEFTIFGNVFDVHFKDYNINVPAHAWKGLLKPTTAKVISRDGDSILGVKNQFGKGTVVWIPELLGLAARIHNNYHPLIGLLEKELDTEKQIRFAGSYDGALMKTLVSVTDYITILVNKNVNSQSIQLEGLNNKTPKILYNNKNGSINNHTVSINSEESMVILRK